MLSFLNISGEDRCRYRHLLNTVRTTSVHSTRVLNITPTLQNICIHFWIWSVCVCQFLLSHVTCKNKQSVLTCNVYILYNVFLVGLFILFAQVYLSFLSADGKLNFDAILRNPPSFIHTHRYGHLEAII